MTRWAILTGEYPPQPGGVSDYTRLIAGGLAARGDSVTVYAPPAPSYDLGSADPGVTVVRLPDRFGLRGIAALENRLRKVRPDRILLQYVPQMYGWKAMNLPFAVWVAIRATPIAPVWIMFHEVMTGARPGHTLRNAIITRVTRQMARTLTRAADRVFVSVPQWGRLLRQIANTAPPAEWLPVPSNIPTAVVPAAVSVVRNRLGTGIVVGHFGTFGGMNASLLGPPFVALLRRRPGSVALFVGRGGDTYRDRVVADYPDLAGRVIATGELAAADAAAHVAACDILIQPYPDGASSRRTSLMAGLALGVPTVTNAGFLSEPVWGTESTGVTVTRSPDSEELVAAAAELLALSPHERSNRGRAAAAWYQSRFAIERVVSHLRTPFCART